MRQQRIRLDEDLHVHSTFSDGKNSIAENLSVAVERGVRRIGCVDHVRKDTDWVPAYAAAVHDARGKFPLEIVCGVEAKMLNDLGELDVPAKLAGVDRIYAADHKWPLGNRCYSPADIVALLENDELTVEYALSSLLRAYDGALATRPNLVFAHPFSILRKCRIPESALPKKELDALAHRMRQHRAWLEIGERWRCPNAATLRVFRDAGVTIVVSTDSHQACDIGLYDYATRTLGELDRSSESVATAEV